MPRSKTKRRTTRTGKTRSIRWGGVPKRRGGRLWTYGLGAAVLIAVAAGGYSWWQSWQAERAFMALASDGRQALERVETIVSRGRAHLDAGQSYDYASRFPTSGPHSPTWTEPGVYRAPQPRTRLVHAIEHGNIVIYYDEPAAPAMATLQRWAGLYDDKWSGLVIVHAAGLDEAVVLTAWTKRLRLERFDAAGAAAFIDAYRGRGPEHPVR